MFSETLPITKVEAILGEEEVVVAITYGGKDQKLKPWDQALLVAAVEDLASMMRLPLDIWISEATDV